MKRPITKHDKGEQTRRLGKFVLILIVLLVGPILCTIWYSVYASN